MPLATYFSYRERLGQEIRRSTSHSMSTSNASAANVSFENQRSSTLRTTTLSSSTSRRTSSSPQQHGGGRSTTPISQIISPERSQRKSPERSILKGSSYRSRSPERSMSRLRFSSSSYSNSDVVDNDWLSDTSLTGRHADDNGQDFWPLRASSRLVSSRNAFLSRSISADKSSCSPKAIKFSVCCQSLYTSSHSSYPLSGASWAI